MRKFFLVLFILPFFLGAQPQLDLIEVADGFQRAVDIVHAGDDRLFVVEQSGTIRVYQNNAILATPFLDLSNKIGASSGERGLLGLAFHPNFDQNGYFYVNHTISQDSITRIARYTVSATDSNRADPASELVILEVEQPFSNHNAGDLAFGPDGYLYIPLGDGGAGNDPINAGQSPGTLLGKLLRIDVDRGTPYAIPADNPFVNKPNIRAEIWASGLRNPWRISFDRATGDLWIGDVGQGAFEEINRQPASSSGGENYGWRCREGLIATPAVPCTPPLPTYTDPVFVYPHVNGGRSVTGGFVYRGSDFPELQGYYVFADFVTGDSWIMQADSLEVTQQTGLPKLNFSTFGEDARGELYTTDYSTGKLYQLGVPLVGIEDEWEENWVQVQTGFSDRITLNFLRPAGQNFGATLFDLQGRNLFEYKGRTAEGVEISVPQLPRGIYVLRIEAQEKITLKKLIYR